MRYASMSPVVSRNMPLRTPHLSPASSIMSLPSDDLSDLSDSEFDIISSVGSARSIDGDAQNDDDNYSEDETDHSIEPSSLLLDQEWYGMIDPTRAAQRPPLLSSATVVPHLNAAATDIMNGATNINSPAVLSVEDIDVIDALAQSLERSSETVHAAPSTSLGASYGNLHFVTSPSGAARRSSSTLLSRSKLLEFTQSPSSSVLQLAFPDPLPSPPAEEAAAPEQRAIDEAPVNSATDSQITITESSPTTLPMTQELSESGLVTVAEKLEEPENELITEEIASHMDQSEVEIKADADQDNVHTAVPAFLSSHQRFDALDICVDKFANHIVSTIVGNRWAASVYVRIQI